VSVLGRQGNGIEATAAQWVVRLGGGPLQGDERHALERWLAEDPAHIAAFDLARATWAELGALKAHPGALTHDLTLVRARPPVRDQQWRRVRTGMVRAAAAVALVAVFGGAAAFWAGNPLLALAADYRTAPGETRSVMLADGSTVELDASSALAVHFNGRERRVELLAGQAYFTVAPVRDVETRPFVVGAMNGTAQALGTQFVVDRDSGQAQVTAAEHQVRVSVTSPGNAQRFVILSPGQTVRYDPASGIDSVTQANIGEATAWRHGRLIFDKVPLAAVVTELNRYRRGRIVLATSGLAARRVSGVFETNDLSEALTAITRELGVRTVALPPFVTILY
jgi:transmembrane sensor